MAARFEYTVEGVGDFPLDMLRRDRAYPADEESVAALAAAFRWAAARKTRTTLIIRLVSDQAPAPDRWRAYGWIVKMPTP